MRLLIDECLHESLAGVAHAAGFEATHVNHLGLSGQPDWAIAERIIKRRIYFRYQQPRGLSSALRQDGSALRPDYPCSERSSRTYSVRLWRGRFTTCLQGIW